MCESKWNRVDQRDPDEGLIGSPRGSSTRLWHRPVVPPSAYPVPTEYPKFDSITRLFNIPFESSKIPASMIYKANYANIGLVTCRSVSLTLVFNGSKIFSKTMESVYV